MTSSVPDGIGYGDIWPGYARRIGRVRNVQQSRATRIIEDMRKLQYVWWTYQYWHIQPIFYLCPERHQQKECQLFQRWRSFRAFGTLGVAKLYSLWEQHNWILWTSDEIIWRPQVNLYLIACQCNLSCWQCSSTDTRRSRLFISASETL